MFCTWLSIAEVEGVVSSSAVARRTQPMLATVTATSRISPPCKRNRREARILLLIEVATAESSAAVPIPAAPTRLLEQPDRRHLHLPIGALHHVVSRQEGHRDRGQRLHFDARLARCANGAVTKGDVLTVSQIAGTMAAK